MTETAALLGQWSNFYMMTGSAAASLTGLMFVVITLVSGEERIRKAPDGISTFSTPTVVHFSAALIVAAVLSAPWRSLVYPAVLLGITALYGIVYILRVMHRTRHLRTYQADIEDWTWYTILPLAAYGAILAGAILFFTVPIGALFACAAGVVALIVIGIRNAWDVVTYIAVGRLDEPPSSE